jgi:hydroxyacylglutathione hydrolase
VAESDEGRFVESVLDGQPEPPRYFAEMKRINRDGPPILRHMPLPPQLATDTIETLARETWLIDLRGSPSFAIAHVPGSLSISYGRSFSTWVGSLVPYDVDLAFLTPLTDVATAAAQGEALPPLVRRAAHDLAMIGLDRIRGWMSADDAISGWTRAGHSTGSVPQLSVTDVEHATTAPLTIIDVRGESEWRSGHLPQAVHIPLGALSKRLSEIPDGPVLMQCQSGARSAIAASLLKRLGRADVRNLTGGYVAWSAAHQPVLT